jgi:hypothetical protein
MLGLLAALLLTAGGDTAPADDFDAEDVVSAEAAPDPPSEASDAPDGAEKDAADSKDDGSAETADDAPFRG